MSLFFLRLYVENFYQPAKSKLEYICSPQNESGIRKCETDKFPAYVFEGIKCNSSAKNNGSNEPTNSSCVNWNQYYTNCAPLANNPYMSSVSFDNIGLAWVAIFQVVRFTSL